VAALPGDFDDGGDAEFTRPLPPEDRLWRHPSELAGRTLAPQLDPLAIRNRWLQSAPSRASAWTAGLVGALLATGLVVLGTHLVTAMSPRAGSVSVALDAPIATDDTLAPVHSALGSALAGEVARVGAATVQLSVSRDGARSSALGLIVDSSGRVVTSASALDGATSVLVTLPGDVVVPAHSIVSDDKSGLALLSVRPTDELPSAPLAASGPATQSMLLALTSAGGLHYAATTVLSSDGAVAIDGDQLLDTSRTDLPAGDAPAGSPVLNARGQVVGIVAGDEGNAQVVPSWLASRVVSELANQGVVHHGFLGVTGESAPGPTHGVLVTAIGHSSAAARSGIEVGDLIVSLNGRPIASMVQLRARLYVDQPGSSVSIGVRRGTSKRVLHIRLAANSAS
jgi:S1-C subfamily serine protease